MADAQQESKRPADTPFKQQRLPAWQPILSPKWVISSYFIIGLIFIPLGIMVVLVSQNVVEVTSEDYTSKCAMSMDYSVTPPRIHCSTNVTLNIPTNMQPPIYIYYRLDNFYQNHRRYAKSRSDSQLLGKSITASSLNEDCGPIVAYVPKNVTDYTNVPDSLVYRPCGLIAYSMFNDTFVLKSENGSTICDGVNYQGTACTKEGIAWSSDRNVKFQKPAADVVNWNGSYYGEDAHKVPDVLDEDLMVWMRTAALPSFRKLYRIINSTPLEKGAYTVQIDQNFPVAKFSGKKYVVISTASFLGGKNNFLGIAYLVVGSLCILIGIFFAVKHAVSGRRLGDLSYINWHEDQNTNNNA